MMNGIMISHYKDGAFISNYSYVLVNYIEGGNDE